MQGFRIWNHTKKSRPQKCFFVFRSTARSKSSQLCRHEPQLRAQHDKASDQEAAKQGKTHKVVLMIDLGDLREGIFFKDEDIIMSTVEEILKLKNIKLHGVGVNLTCYGAVIPKQDNLQRLLR